jgi:hypothetical protein
LVPCPNLISVHPRSCVIQADSRNNKVSVATPLSDLPLKSGRPASTPTKRNETKRNETKRNETKRDEHVFAFIDRVDGKKHDEETHDTYSYVVIPTAGAAHGLLQSRRIAKGRHAGGHAKARQGEGWYCYGGARLHNGGTVGNSFIILIHTAVYIYLSSNVQTPPNSLPFISP